MVSVIMSVYNEPEDWLKSSVDSILTQSYENFEFIIVNDNPTSERQSELLENFKLKDARITLITNEENSGLTFSLNRGIQVAKGKYIARMDADDISEPERLAIQVRILESNNHIVACGTNYYKINHHGKRIEIINTPISDLDIRYKMLLYNPIAHPTLMFRKSSVEKDNIQYDETLRYAQDYRLIFDLSKLGELYNIQQCLLHYRVSGSQISSAKKAEQNKCAQLTRERIFVEAIEKLEISTDIRSGIYGNNSKILFSCLREYQKLSSSKLIDYLFLSLALNGKLKLGQKIFLFCFGSFAMKNRLKILKNL